jgi:hypothetical protein
MLYTNIFHSKTLQNIPKLGFLKPSGNPDMCSDRRTYQNSMTDQQVAEIIMLISVLFLLDPNLSNLKNRL